MSILLRVDVSARSFVEFFRESANLFQYVELKKGCRKISEIDRSFGLSVWKISNGNQMAYLHFHDAQAMKFCSSTVNASPFRAHISRLLISAQVDRRFEIRF